MDDNDVHIYHHPNPEMKSFLTQEDISSMRVEHFGKPIGNISDPSLRFLGPIGSRIVKEALAIAGIRDIRIKPQELLVRKEEAAAWDEIVPEVVAILKRSLRRKGLKIVKRR